MLALFLKVSAFSFSVWKLSEGVIVPCSVFALSMLIVMFSENSICAPIRTGGKRRRKRRSKDRFIGESSKKPVRGHCAPVGGVSGRRGCFLEIESCVSGRTLRGVSWFAKRWPSRPVGPVVLPIVVAPPRSGNRDEALFVVEC